MRGYVKKKKPVAESNIIQQPLCISLTAGFKLCCKTAVIQPAFIPEHWCFSGSCTNKKTRASTTTYGWMTQQAQQYGWLGMRHLIAQSQPASRRSWTVFPKSACLKRNACTQPVLIFPPSAVPCWNHGEELSNAVSSLLLPFVYSSIRPSVLLFFHLPHPFLFFFEWNLCISL